MYNDEKQKKQSKEIKRLNLNFENIINIQMKLLIFIYIYIY